MAVVRYLVADVDAAVEFYTRLFGFELVERWGPPFAMVKRDDLTLWVSGPGSSASGLVETLARAGARFRGDVTSGPGGKQVLLDDPSGNPIELFEPAD
jgi:catechol 2,3-dioxygenase-like lactoylglutathione lyase family enzyme